MRKFYIFHFLLQIGAIFLIDFGCATTTNNKSNRNRASSNQEANQTNSQITNKEQKFLDDYKSEVELGRSMAGRLIAFYGSYGDQGLIRYVNQVAAYVASNSDFSERKYMVAILTDETVNAFACPGGYILITMGAIRHAISEAELAAILGHEVAHVGNQHMIKTLKSMNEKDLNELQEKKSKETLPPSVLARKRPDPEESVFAKSITKTLSAATGGVGLNLLVAAKAGMNVILEKGMDKKYELEADREGVAYAIKSGYDPKAMDKFLFRLEKKKEREAAKSKESKKDVSDKDVMDKTHPPLAERRNQIAQVLSKMKADEIVGATGRARFASYYKQLPSKAEQAEAKESRK